jgi:hypothetical protein
LSSDCEAIVYEIKNVFVFHEFEYAKYYTPKCENIMYIVCMLSIQNEYIIYALVKILHFSQNITNVIPVFAPCDLTI